MRASANIVCFFKAGGKHYNPSPDLAFRIARFFQTGVEDVFECRKK